MSFVVRHLSRTADGREIVRARTYRGNRIVIGRDAASEIHLPDLAVELNHAELLLLESGRVDIQSVCGLGFLIDGRSVQHGEIDPTAGAELRVGSHLLTIGSDGGTVLIAVERVEALSDASSSRDEHKLFTLHGLLPGRRPAAWAAIAAILLLFLAWPIYTFATSPGDTKRDPGFHADRLWSTGALSQAHRGLSNNCQACHTQKFVAVTDAACATCHKDDAHAHAPAARLARAKQAPGIAGSLNGAIKAAFNRPEGRCVDCHTEHEGAGPMTPTAQAFCSDCHGSLDARLNDTVIANAGDFGTAHPQFRPTVGVGIDRQDRRLTRRVAVGKAISDENGLKFPHGTHLSTTNGVARMARTMRAREGWGDALACKDCHQPTPDGVRFRPVDMEADCAMCHSLAFDQVGGTFRTLRHGEPEQVVADLRAFYRAYRPNRPVSLGGMARRRPGSFAAQQAAQTYYIGARDYPRNAEAAIRAVFSKGGACFDCHVVTPGGSSARPYAIRKVFQPARYFSKGWFDHEAHSGETCQSCHKAGQSKAATDLLIPDLASCRTCHVGDGGARLTPVKQPVESSCAMCHDYHADAGAPWLTRTRIDRGVIASAR